MRLRLFPSTRRGWFVLASIIGAFAALYALFEILALAFPSNELLTGGYFADLLFKGLVLGAVYALIALGYTMVYGVIQLINFAHGEIYMLGAYFGYYFLRIFIEHLHLARGISLFAVFALAMLCSMLCCSICGVIMEKFAYLPLRKSTRIAALITAVGMSFFLQNLGLIVFSPNPRSFSPNTFAVYVVEVSNDSDFSSAYARKTHQNSRIEIPYSGDAYVRVKAKTPGGSSDWSEPVFLGADGIHAIGEFADETRHLPGVVPAPAGIVITRDMAKNTIAIAWTESPKEFRNLAAIVPDKTSFVPLDFGIGANKSQEGGSRRFGFNAAPIHLLILAVTAITLICLWWLINKSKFGVAMRAVSFDKDATRLMGIDTDSVISLTFALGSALAAVAGCLVGLYLIRIDPLMGVLPGIKAFVAAVVGGIGSIPGAAAGGLIMGISETLVKGYIPSRISPLADAVAFAFLIVVLLVKPTGLMGKVVKEKV